MSFIRASASISDQPPAADLRDARIFRRLAASARLNDAFGALIVLCIPTSFCGIQAYFRGYAFKLNERVQNSPALFFLLPAVKLGIENGRTRIR